MRTAFLTSLTEMMRHDDNIIVITADMGFSVFEGMQREFPSRFINTGVTEQSTIGISAGLALSGYTVYVYAQAPFATMRCFEQVRLDVAYNNVNVKIIGTAAGYSLNQLGISHFATEDIALMRLLPNMTVFTPGDPYEAHCATKLANKIQGPVYIRITNNSSQEVHRNQPKFEIGKGIKVRDGKDACLLVSGSLLPFAVEIADNLAKIKKEISVISIHTIKPLDKELILKEATRTKKLFSLEEHGIIGGLGSAVAEVLAEGDVETRFLRLGAPDAFTSVTGSRDYLLAYNGISKEIIQEKIIGTINSSK